MFKSATIKLTFWYVVFTMTLSFIFSGVLYQFSTHELKEALHNQYKVLQENDHDEDNLVNKESSAELSDRSQHLFQNLIYFNILVLIGASISSYVLARRTLRPIEIAHKAQIRFSAEASHELRTPLAAMKADTESVLMQHKPSQAILKRTLEANLMDIQKLEKLTNHLLDISSYKNQIISRGQPVELEPIITNAIKQLNHLSKAKNIEIRTNIKPLMVMAEPQSLEQLIVIVLDNAIKYSPAKTTISIQLTGGANQAELVIKDQGIGISSEDLPHIFEHFYRAKNEDIAQDKTTGYGLGLSLAKGIVELYDGTINIKSTEKQGTTVKIRLPLA